MLVKHIASGVGLTQEAEALEKTYKGYLAGDGGVYMCGGPAGI